MKKNLLSLTLLIFGFALGATALSALAQSGEGSWFAPDCTPGTSNCNTPAPVNAGKSKQEKLGALWVNTNTTVGDTIAEIGLVVGGKIKITGGDPAPGKVLMATNEHGEGEWRSLPSTSISPLVPFMNYSLLAYGESHSVVNGVNNTWAKLYESAALVPGQKYAVIILTSAANNVSAPARTLLSGFGVDSGKKIQIRCGDNGSFAAGPVFSPINIGQVVNSTQVSYQGTVIYNPDKNYTGTVHGSWGLIPYTQTSGQTINKNYHGIWGQESGMSSYNGCVDGRGYYMLYVFEPEVLKSVMDRLYAITGNPKHKYNDPLSSDSSLHNGAAWFIE